MILLCLLGKHDCKELRSEDILVDNNSNAAMIEHDYTEALKAEFDMEIQSESFGFNRTLSI